VVNSFTLSVVGLSVDVSQFGRFKYCITQSVKVGFEAALGNSRYGSQLVSHIFCYLVRPQNRLWLPPEPRFRFRFGFYRKSRFRF